MFRETKLQLDIRGITLMTSRNACYNLQQCCVTRGFLYFLPDNYSAAQKVANKNSDNNVIETAFCYERAHVFRCLK